MSLLLATGGGGGGPVNYTLICAVGAYTYTGQAATLRLDRRLPLAAGAYVYTGQAATLVVNRRLSLAAGAYTYTGQAATLLVNRRLQLAAGAYAYSGQAAALHVDRRLALDAGAYVYAGNAATLTYVPGAGAQNYTLGLVAGSYTYAGSDITLTYTPGESSDIPMGGGGYPVWRKKEAKGPSNSVDALWDLVLSEHYDDLPKAAKKQAAAIVKPYSSSRSKLPKSEDIDWAALEMDLARVEKLISIFEEQRLMRAIEADDEDIFMMMN